jgi:hypothetical protein
MIDGPDYTGQSMLDGFIFDSPPQGASPHARGALLWIDDCIFEITRGRLQGHLSQKRNQRGYGLRSGSQLGAYSSSRT